MKAVVGIIARGEDFFPRQNITDEIWEKLNKGNHLVIVAPRRVGKSSILMNLVDNPRKGFLVVYFMSEPINNINEFYKKLYNHILDLAKTSKRLSKKALSFGKNLLSRIDEFSATELSIKLGTSKISYLDELINLLESFALKNERIIVLVDEFAATVENIIRDTKDEQTAIHFLQTKREIRQNPFLAKKIQFVYAGSIGLENIVSRINGISFINDLTPILIPPINEDEARQLVDKIIADPTVTLDKKSFEYLLEKIEWWIPYYFQLLLDEINKILTNRKINIITKEVIDNAVTNSLDQRIYFEHWEARLRSAYKGDEISFVKNVLNVISQNRTITSSEILNLAVKYKLENSYINLINALKHDGYINNNENTKIYRFNSPLLREWWSKNVAN